tara:strand:+ start:182 stop:1030 length:849 start_codon:yes stop_codon:yes gene_type:complete
MAIQPSGAISLSDIQTEFTGSNPISISEYYRGLLVTTNNTGVPTSGAITLANFYGAVRQFAFAITGNLTTPQNLRALAVAAGWDGSAPVVATNSAIISSNTTGSPALIVNGSFPAGVTLLNTGTIVGMGGAGNGGVGGIALTASVAISINNSGTLAGGGGGGGYGTPGGTGGNLGGYGGGGGGRSGLTNSSGGAGQGGVVFPGSAGGSGTFSAIGAAGGAGYPPYGGRGGVGGDWGSTGENGVNGSDPVWNSPQAGAAGGAAVSGNSYVTWVATGTLRGSLV